MKWLHSSTNGMGKEDIISSAVIMYQSRQGHSGTGHDSRALWAKTVFAMGSKSAHYILPDTLV